MMETKTPEWIRDMIALHGRGQRDLGRPASSSTDRASSDPSEAKTVRFENGAPVATDGPYAEAKESLAGYWLVDVPDEARALEIASRVVAFTQ